jgi:corrinoid protein of di/trimethylamine methyltransferase
MMTTHKEKILMAARGEMPEVLPYVPRFDLWYNANAYADTLPPEHKGRTADEIARAEGWALHKVIPELLTVDTPEENLHRGLGLYSLKENGYWIHFSSNVEVRVHQSGDTKRVEYHTPVGMVSVTEVITEEMRSAGASITWLEERAIKTVDDYRILKYIFENIEIKPDYERYRQWQQNVGDDGVAIQMGAFAPSPIQHIQRDLLEATEFFYHYNDYQKEMQDLAEGIEHVYEQLLQTVVKSSAEIVLWGANYDDMITYPTYFEKEITPWLQKASHALAENGKLMISHTDGENRGLMDLIHDSGIHIAEAVCPYPMMRVKIEDYYRQWCDKITIFGGIPQSLLTEETASEEDFQSYLDHFFKAVAPGRRIIVGVADTTPPNAVFDRLRRLGDRVAREGRLPLAAGDFRPISPSTMDKSPATPAPEISDDEDYKVIRQDVLKGNQAGIKEHVQEMLNQGFAPNDILNYGMLSTMEVIGVRFKTGEVFIPEVLLSARAMNEALKVLEPYLAKEKKEASGKLIIGTVRGDLHDIGKNMVVTMLRGVGFEVEDLGININVDVFVEKVAELKPDILGLSALLTTTMPEMRKIINALAEAGLRDQVKVMVGGAPVNETYARQIGADGYAVDAGESVEVAKRLLE